MDEQRARNEFDRIRLTDMLNKSRENIRQYEEGLAFFRQRVEDVRYQLGRLDERLEGEQ